jgi:hypothetical protein
MAKCSDSLASLAMPPTDDLKVGSRGAPGLSQSEVAGNEKHHHNNTNDIENIVHVSFSFLSRDRITVEPDAHNTNY